jgi:pyruvate/2-oxoglutarate dehydrogenase complex dihydrolipoamide dehydrogenase (E3) component
METVTSPAPGAVEEDPERRLLDNVRPPAWRNPEPADRYDLLVIGAGTGGLVSAAIGAALGARVALVERSRMGGDCLNHGCVPSKAVLRAARSWAEASGSAERFGGPAVTGPGDFSAAMDRMRRIRAEISDVDAAARFASLGVDVFFGDARFDSESSVLVNGETRLRFRRAILATGARAAVPPIPGLDTVGYLTNETIFDLRELPASLVVLGAGPIGCELAQAFARFGSTVTLVDMEERVLPREEPDAAALVQAALERDGVRFIGGAKVTRVERGRAGANGATTVVFEADGEEDRVEGDALLLALGRTPNLELELDVAGVDHDRQGVRTDDRLATTNRRIYAVGDIASPFQFTHAADAQARLAVRNALFFGRQKARDLVIPWATYTSPELARVGMSTAEADEAGVEIDTVTIPLDDVDRARLDGATDGFVRIHVRKDTDKIVGATIISPQAGDLIAQVAQAMTLGIGLEKLSGVVFPYPTTAEALRKAADARRRERLTPRTRRMFGLFFKVWRRFA